MRLIAQRYPNPDGTFELYCLTVKDQVVLDKTHLLTNASAEACDCFERHGHSACGQDCPTPGAQH